MGFPLRASRHRAKQTLAEALTPASGALDKVTSVTDATYLWLD